MRSSRVIAGFVVFLVAITSVALAALPPGGTFIDDDGNPFEGSIEAIAAEGITKGCNPPVNNKYCPNDNVTRGEMALFLVRAMGYTDNGGGNLFTDDDGLFYEDAADKLGAAKVTLGCNPPANDKFCGDDNVTRGQMAAFLVRAKGYTDNGGGNLFTDDDGHFFENDIDKLATAGVTKGCGPALFCPDDLVTRGQMAAFLTRALGLTEAPPPTVPTTTTTTTTATPPTEMSIVGNADFVQHTETALGLLEGGAPGGYDQVVNYIYTIVAVSQGSGMDVFTKTFLVGESTAYAPGFSRDDQVVWYAGSMVHDSCHSRLYSENAAYTGRNAELECLDDQLAALQDLGHPYFENYVTGLIDGVDEPGNDYWNDPNRHW